MRFSKIFKKSQTPQFSSNFQNLIFKIFDRVPTFEKKRFLIYKDIFKKWLNLIIKTFLIIYL